MSRNDKKNEEMSAHPELQKTLGATKSHKTKRAVAGGGSKTSWGSSRFSECVTADGKGYVVGKLIGEHAAADTFLVCISKEDWVGPNSPKGPCRHITLGKAQITLPEGVTWDPVPELEVVKA